MAKQRRGTAIVQTERGILLTRTSNDLFVLPGGKAESGEPRIVTAIRELKEETHLKAESAIFLFSYESKFYMHKVFFIKASGTPVASHEVSSIGYFPEIKEKFISNSSMKIIQHYLATKTEYFRACLKSRSG